MSDPYTRHVGVKFEPNGIVRRFPGNTVICMVDPGTSVHRLLVWAQQLLLEMKCISKFSPLPTDSFHMTIHEGVCDQVRKPDKWPAAMPLSASLDEVRQFFKLRARDIALPESFTMTFDRIDTGDVIKLDLAPSDAASSNALATFRDDLARATTLRFADQDAYLFHISLAYMISELQQPERAELEDVARTIEQRLREEFGTWTTGSPQLCYFDDMFEFVPE